MWASATSRGFIPEEEKERVRMCNRDAAFTAIQNGESDLLLE